MEINNNISSNSIQDLQKVTDFIDLNKVDVNQINNHLENQSNSYSLDQNVPSRRSELSNNLNQYTSVIGQSQIQLSNLNQQSSILNDIAQTTASVSVENPVENVEVSLVQLMNNYNDIAPRLQLTLGANEDTSSQAYFDGVLGAKPLSIADINAAVDAQMKLVEQNITSTNNQIQEVKTKAINTIGEEVSKNEANKPFKSMDFGKATGDFTSANLNNVIGSVALTQANAIPVQAQKLLV